MWSQHVPAKMRVVQYVYHYHWRSEVTVTWKLKKGLRCRCSAWYSKRGSPHSFWSPRYQMLCSSPRHCSLTDNSRGRMPRTLLWASETALHNLNHGHEKRLAKYPCFLGSYVGEVYNVLPVLTPLPKPKQSKLVPNPKPLKPWHIVALLYC